MIILKTDNRGRIVIRNFYKEVDEYNQLEYHTPQYFKAEKRHKRIILSPINDKENNNENDEE